MATLREAICKIIDDDAKLTAAGTLGNLLSYNATSKPDCFIHANSPETPAIPYLTYFISDETSFFPRNIFFNFTAWGNNFEAILARVYDLLHKKIEITASDYSTKAVLFEWASADLWDDDLKCYYKQARYRVITVKI
jgi:hypothetical protein